MSTFSFVSRNTQINKAAIGCPLILKITQISVNTMVVLFWRPFCRPFIVDFFDVWRHLMTSFSATYRRLLASLLATFWRHLTASFTQFIISSTSHVIVRFEGRLLHFTTLKLSIWASSVLRLVGRLYTYTIYLILGQRAHLAKKFD